MSASKRIKREKASLPVDVCHPKTPLLKLPNTIICHFRNKRETGSGLLSQRLLGLLLGTTEKMGQ